MKKQLLITALSALMATSAMAADEAAGTGTITISGTISNAGCHVAATDLDQLVDFHSIPSATVTATAVHGLVVDALPVQFNVSGCPNTMTKATVGLTYSHAGPYYIDNKGSATGIGVTALKAAEAASHVVAAADIISSGTDATTVDLTNGAGVVEFWIGVTKIAAAFTTGTIDASVDVAMKYQ